MKKIEIKANSVIFDMEIIFRQCKIDEAFDPARFATSIRLTPRDGQHDLKNFRFVIPDEIPHVSKDACKIKSTHQFIRSYPPISSKSDGRSLAAAFVDNEWCGRIEITNRTYIGMLYRIIPEVETALISTVTNYLIAYLDDILGD